eukprot:TRINITY_DN83142_c0_g1_i1.p1 TRINITY_DN83142_c0_g1~~TRINITY_DN83142_c0_g1_i1.p1  ORF type:complete len:283 (-),score=63.22 TRINITY_DN83142_c0_g1_i1:11-859(-)
MFQFSRRFSRMQTRRLSAAGVLLRVRRRPVCALSSVTPGYAPAATCGSRRGFGWTSEDTMLSFKVKGGDDVSFPKLAGGLLKRCEQGLDTVLECMGSASISNGVKAVVRANRYAHEQLEAEDTASERKAELPRAVAFTPFFFARGENRGVRLTAVRLDDKPELLNESAGCKLLRVGRKTDLDGLNKAIDLNWKKFCDGESQQVAIAAMGPEPVSLAVKAAAHALRETLQRRRPDTPPFVCFPLVAELEVERKQERPVMVTYLILVRRPPTAGRKRSNDDEEE